jgi:gliding motility-associated-like protein
VYSGLGCNDHDSVSITAAPPVKIGITPQFSFIPYGGHVQLMAYPISPDPLIYYWQPNDGSLDNPNINNPVARPLDSTTYVVYGRNIWGCLDSAVAVIDIDKGSVDVVPSAFTPNGDHLNDIFRVSNLKYKRLIDFKVFNRYGEMVFENSSGDVTKGWDGTYKGVKQDMGTYNYAIILGEPDGTDKVIKGTVTLIR